VVVTGAATLKSRKPYRIVELQPANKDVDFSLANAIRFNWRYALATRRLLSAQAFDIIHHVLPFALENTFNLSWLVNRPSNTRLVLGPVQKLREADTDATQGRRLCPGMNLGGVVRPVTSRLSAWTLARADRIVAVNNEAKRDLERIGASSTKIRVITPGIDSKRFAPDATNKGRSDVLQLLAVGQLVERKGIDLVLRALAQVIHRRQNLRLTILGDGPQKQRLGQLIRDLALGGVVDLVGRVPNSEVHTYYQRAHVFVNMSRSEGFSVVCLEAMASGLAIVASRVGGFVEAIRDGVNGFLVDVGDYEALAQRLSAIADNREAIVSAGAAARRDAEIKFDWDRSIIPQYLDLYRDALAE
jgi:glycosyltransferase involved in cell wall biosynthesis